MKAGWRALAAIHASTIATRSFADATPIETVATSAATTDSPPAQGRSEPYLISGFTYYGSDRRVLAGLGGGPGYRLHLSRHLSTYTEVRWVTYLGNTFTGSLGMSFEFPIGPLNPLAGFHGTIYGGDRVQVIDSAHPAPPPPLAWAAQVRLAPLRLVHAAFAVTTLSADVGLGIDDKSRALALTINLLDIGVRF